MVRSRGLEPPRVAPLAPQASASTNSATTAVGQGRSQRSGALDVTNRSPANKGSPGRHHPTTARRPRVAPLASAHIFQPPRQPLDLDCNAIAADHDRALRHREIVGQDRDLVLLRGIELDDGARPRRSTWWIGISVVPSTTGYRARLYRAWASNPQGYLTPRPDHAMVSR